ncbi:hypothetical protein MP228_004129 [Amoeboaphelidium protococcarum]|nr:hypothetical protein MP228_004129 [Amoeboaphelidium protococcarum]
MGKRKSTRAPVKRQKQTLDKTFTCLFCNHESAIAVRIVKDQQIGTVNCRMCGVNWSCKITPLDEAIDVYANWVDACEDAQQQQHLQQPIEQFIRGGGAPSVQQQQKSLLQKYSNGPQQSAGRAQVQSQQKSALGSGNKQQSKQQNNKPIQKRNRSDSVDSFVTNDSDDDGEFGQDAGEDGSDIDEVSIQGGSGGEEEEEAEEAVETEEESEGDDDNDQAIAQSRKLVSSKLGDRPWQKLSDDDDSRQQSADNIQPESSNIPKRRAIISDDDDD